MRRLYFQKLITRYDLRANPDVLYVFGDNEARVGMGGQAAECRGEPNAVGVATKRDPATFWTEEDAARQCEVVSKDMERLFQHDGLIVWPLDGIGTGLSELPKRSPTTYAFILQHISKL